MKRLFQAFVCLIALLGLTMGLSSCIDIVTPYAISYPVNGGSYVGFVDDAAPTPQEGSEALASQFSFTLDKPPTSSVDVTLNGHDIGKYFKPSPESNTVWVADVISIKHFFRQGSNRFTVDPWGFGPSHSFTLDTAGPTIIVTHGDMTYADRKVRAYDPQGIASGEKTVKEPANVVISGFLRDPSAVGNTVVLELHKITGYQSNGKIVRVPISEHTIQVNPDRTFQSEPIPISDIIEEEVWFNHDGDFRTPEIVATNNEYYLNDPPLQLAGKGAEATKKVSLLYKFRTTDAHGYESTREYLADSEHAGTLGIDNAVRAAVGGSVIESMRPLIATGLASAMELAPIHGKCSQVGPHADPRLRKQGVFADGWYPNGEYYDHNNNRVYPANAQDVLDMNAAVVAPESCLFWDNKRVCDGVKGVYPGQNLTQADFDEQDAADGTEDGLVDDKPITHADFACNDKPLLSDGSESTVNMQDGSRAGGGPMYLPIELLGMVIKFDAFLRETILLNGEKNPDGTTVPVELGGNPYTNIGGEELGGKHGTMLLNGFSIKENNRLNIDMEITHMAAGITMAGTAPLGEAITIDMAMYIGGVSVDADAIVSAKGTKVDVSLDPNSTNIAISGVKVTDMVACMETWDPLNIIPPICITLPPGIINPIMDPLLGLIGGMIPAIANPIIAANLQKIAIGGAVAGLQDGTEFDMTMNVAELGTQSASTEFDLVAGLESVADITVADPFVSQALGPIFNDDPVDPGDVLNGTEAGGPSNLTVAISSNLINQSLAAAYATGSTHLTMYKGKTYFGAHPLTPGKPETMTDPEKAYLEDLDGDGPGTERNTYTETLAKVGDTRVRLWPDMPPALNFSEVVGSDGAGLAQVKYESATAYYDELISDKGTLTWKTLLSMKVDFDLGVTIDENDGTFTMASGGPPSLNINHMENFTNIQIPSSIVQIAVDLALGVGGDFLADQFLVLDLNKIAGAALNKEAGGTEFTYRSTSDLYTQPVGDATDCIVYKVGEDGKDTSEVEDARDAEFGGDGVSDLVCKKVSFDVATHNVGTIGSKGSNLFFQMSAIDANFPKPRGLPRLDLDEDGFGKFDYQDNCAVNRFYLSKAVDQVKVDRGVSELVKENGDLIDALVDGEIKAEVNALLALDFADSRDAVPTPTDIDNWNSKRVGDTPFADLAALGPYPWITLMYSNRNQYNSNGNDPENPDRVGELCESDIDFDGVWDDNAGDVDNCPGIPNADQADSMLPIGEGAGDACNVQVTYVLLRSLGSRYTNPSLPDSPDGADYKCLSHSAYTQGTGVENLNGAYVSADMNNAANPTVKTCNKFDVSQRWYIERAAGSDEYRIFSGESRDNANDWRLGAWNKNRTAGHLKMIKFNADVDIIGGGSNEVGGTWKLRKVLASAENFDAPTAIEKENFSHPWILQPQVLVDASKSDCLSYNTDGWGPDFGENDCAFDDDGKPVNSGLPSKFYRWGIYVEGEQLWDGAW